MKKKIFSFILAGFLLISLTIVGQNKEYPTKKVNGIEYYLYTIQAGDGLFGIGRKFEVSPEEISKANPEVQKGIKTGQQILIPKQKKTADKTSEKQANINSSKVFKEHKVQKNETLFAISNKYNVSQEDIIKLNPEIKKGLREGIVLQIPKVGKAEEKGDREVKKTEKKVVVSVQTKIEPDNNSIDLSNIKHTTHLVQPNETLYSLGRLYNVKVVDIIRLNPGSAGKLVVGTEVNIPISEEVTTKDSKSVTIANNQIRKTDSLKLVNKEKVIQIAFLTPFMLEQNKLDPSVERFVDFYAGALMAVQEAKEKGISLEIYTYDTEKSEEKITTILSKPELKNMDLIIGPAFSNQVSLVANFAKVNKINTLIPFSSKVPEIESNPYLFQFNPGSDTEIKFTLDLLNGKYKNAHIIFAEIPSVSSFDEGKIRAEALQKELNNRQKSFTKIELTTSDNADFKTSLIKGEKNIVIFNTDKFVYISPFIEPLRAQADDYDIVLFKQYNWKNKNNKMPVSIYISPFRIKENSSRLTTYDELFTQRFSKEISLDSPRFDLLGYDLSGYFISLLYRYDTKFIDKISTFNYSNDIQSQPLFERISNESGFMNQRLYLGEDKAE